MGKKKPRVLRGFVCTQHRIAMSELLIKTVEQLVVLLIDPLINLVVAGATAMLLNHGLSRPMAAESALHALSAAIRSSAAPLSEKAGVEIAMAPLSKADAINFIVFMCLS